VNPSVADRERRGMQAVALLALLFVIPFWTLALVGAAPIEDIVPGYAPHTWSFLAADVWITWRSLCILQASRRRTIADDARLRESCLVLGGTFVPFGLYELAYGLGTRTLLRPFDDVALDVLAIAFLLTAGPWLVTRGSAGRPDAPSAN
jgi:hypothetical protein